MLRRLISGRWLFSRQGAGIFLGLVGGDDDADFEIEVDAVADNIHAGEIFRVPASRFIYHGAAFDVNPFSSRGTGKML